MSTVAADLPLFARAILALAAVLVLLLAARWALARRGLGWMAPTRCDTGLAIAETLPLDSRNRLVVICRGGVELVLAIGPQGVSTLEFPMSPAGSGRAGSAFEP